MPRKNGDQHEDQKLTVDIRVYCSPEFKRVLSKMARERELPLSELLVQLVADKIERPDLAKIPRKSWGRPLKDEIEPATV